MITRSRYKIVGRPLMGIGFSYHPYYRTWFGTWRPVLPGSGHFCLSGKAAELEILSHAKACHGTRGMHHTTYRHKT